SEGSARSDGEVIGAREDPQIAGDPRIEAYRHRVGAAPGHVPSDGLGEIGGREGGGDGSADEAARTVRAGQVIGGAGSVPAGSGTRRFPTSVPFREPRDRAMDELRARFARFFDEGTVEEAAAEDPRRSREGDLGAFSGRPLEDDTADLDPRHGKDPLERS